MAEDVKAGGGVDNCKNETDKRSLSKNSNEALDYLTSDTKKTFVQLKQAFTKAPIFWYFNPEYHIQIKIDTLGYNINKTLSKLTLDNLG